MGKIILIVSVPIIYFYWFIGLPLAGLGFFIMMIERRDENWQNQKIEAKKYEEEFIISRNKEPLSENTFLLAKKVYPIILEDYKYWLGTAVNTLEAEFREKNTNIFHFSSDDDVPQIKIKKSEYADIFLRKGNYKNICKYLDRKVFKELESELDKLNYEKKEEIQNKLQNKNILEFKEKVQKSIQDLEENQFSYDEIIKVLGKEYSWNYSYFKIWKENNIWHFKYAESDLFKSKSIINN